MDRRVATATERKNPWVKGIVPRPLDHIESNVSDNAGNGDSADVAGPGAVPSRIAIRIHIPLGRHYLICLERGRFLSLSRRIGQSLLLGRYHIESRIALPPCLSEATKNSFHGSSWSAIYRIIYRCCLVDAFGLPSDTNLILKAFAQAIFIRQINTSPFAGAVKCILDSSESWSYSCL